MEIITSASNKIVKDIRALGDKKGRERAGAFLVEGAKFVAEIGTNWEILKVVASESFARENCLNTYGERVSIVSDRIFASISDVRSPQGILAVVAKRNFGLGELVRSTAQPLFILEEINDPGNLGTIVRTCHGLGAGGLILSPDCADIYSPKVVRASAGSLLHLPFVVMGVQQAISALKAHGLSIYATSPKATGRIFDLDLQRPSAIMLGNEHRGLKPETAALADFEMSIPIAAESLNVSVACAIIAYEALRQRSV